MKQKETNSYVKSVEHSVSALARNFLKTKEELQKLKTENQELKEKLKRNKHASPLFHYKSKLANIVSNRVNDEEAKEGVISVIEKYIEKIDFCIEAIRNSSNESINGFGHRNKDKR